MHRLLMEDPEFNSLRLNSVVVNRVPDMVISVDELSERSWSTDDDSIDSMDDSLQGHGSEQILELSNLESKHVDSYRAHLDGGSQASTTNDLAVLWGYKKFTEKNPCRVRLICADGRTPVVPTGYGTVRIPAENNTGYVPIRCYYTPEIPNFIISPRSFESLLGSNCGGYTLQCNNEDKSFVYSLTHKLRDSENITVRGSTVGGLCYTRPVLAPLPQTEEVCKMSLQEADHAGLTAIEDHPKNTCKHELEIYKLSVKQERLLWHQRLGHCGREQLCRAHMFADGVPKISGKTSAIDNCPVCLAANMKARERGDGVTRTATKPGQGLSLDFSFAGQASKNSQDEKQMRINDYMGIHGETCYLLLYDHATERLDGVCRQSKAPPIAWLRRWLTKHVADDVKDRYVFMDQGGELYKSKAVRDLFEKEFDYEIRPTGTAAHHQNGLVERANYTVDKAIRAMLIGAGLEIKFWPYAFYHFLRIKNSALPRRDAEESAHQKLNGCKDDLSLLRTFGCRLWVKILAWKNKAKYVQDTKKGIFLGYRTNTLKNVVWYDPDTKRVKYGYHVRFDEGYNDLPREQLPPNVLLLDRHEECMPVEKISVTIPPFTTSTHPFFYEHDVKVTVKCKHPTYGFVLKEDDCLKRVFIKQFTPNGGKKSRYSCNTIGDSQRAINGKYRGAFITAIDDEAIVSKDQALEKFAELRAAKVKSFTMVLASEPKPSADAVRRAYDELELPGFDLDEDDMADTDKNAMSTKAQSSLSPSKTSITETSYVPELGTVINKEFKGGIFYSGKVVDGPYEIDDSCGRQVTVWKVL